MNEAEKPNSEESVNDPQETTNSQPIETTETADGGAAQQLAGDEYPQNGQVQDSAEALVAANEEIAVLKDSFLRAKAEQDNIRRRSEKEIANSRKFAVENFAKEMLNVRDSLKMACTQELTDDADEAIQSVYQGVTITLKQLDAAFAKFGLVIVSPEVGDKLDLNLHQAMSLIESEDIAPGCVINLIQDGFTLHDRLLRPAMVVVSK